MVLKEGYHYQIIPDKVDVLFKPGFYLQMLAFRKLITNKKLQFIFFGKSQKFKTFEIENVMTSNNIFYLCGNLNNYKTKNKK